MSNNKSPQRWAIDLSRLLQACYGGDRFPVDIKSLAKNYTHQVFPDEPITLVKGAHLEGFEGGLYKNPRSKGEWGIIYNSNIISPGRINFTLAHEFGHYLIHRHQYPDGLQCSAEDMSKWDSEYGQIEQQANEFAATLLMPRDDFEEQISPTTQIDFDSLSACADRYGVSLSAATLRWLQFTRKRAMFVVSRDGYVLWARSSQKALRSGVFIRTVNVPPVELPSKSLAARTDLLSRGKGVAEHDASVWLNEACREETLISEQYEKTYTLLHFGTEPSWSDEEEYVEDTFSRIIKAHRG